MKLVPALDRQVFVPTAEDVIITKLRWILTAGRSKDHADVATVIAVQRDKLDWDYIFRWCEQHGTRTIVDEIRAEIADV